ncbi:hypothetical protein GCM10025870_27130 [Agromyces marinus]|uniref:Uncharacterized protein n=1 Tax=Agromyces marinus TaxID=1389020 RepID=A0ABM8H4A6_9MICO|nr:hypothetical protein GCM10025870_27130 [Agromyces marinus]
MVGEHERDVDRELTGTLPEQQVVDAVPGGRGEHEGPERSAHLVEVQFHAPAFDDRGEGRLELAAIGGDSTCTRMKNLPVSWLANCWLSVMLPRAATIAPLTAWTMPGPSVQLSVRTQ